MKHAWKHLTSFVALLVMLSATADGRQKPQSATAPPPRPAVAADPLRVVFEKKGYVAIPLTQEEKDEQFTVVCKSGTETFRMILDTGAENSSLDIGLVNRLGLKHGDEVKTVGIGGNRKGVDVSLRGISIGAFDSRAMARALPFNAFDFTVTNTAQDQRKLPRIDGHLAHSTLWHTAAVIDYSTRTLYLRTPLDGLWPAIEGKWVAGSGQEDGKERKIDPNAPPRLEFKDRQFHLTDGTKSYTLGLHVNKQPGEVHYAVALFDPKQQFAKELNYKAGGMLKVSGDKLTVCLCLDPATAKGMPDDFTAPAGSGRLLLEFRREKPRPGGKPVPAADPIRATLEKKGYVAVPLIQEDEGWGFIVECKSGTETRRMLLDTGAEVSVLDMSVVKKLGLKLERELTANGAGGTQAGVEVSLRGLTFGAFDTRATFNALGFAAIDLTAMNTVLREQRKLRPIDGLLGHLDLRHYGAVIDYSTRTLYLRKPIDSLWPEIEGKWVAVSGEEDGQERKIDAKAPPTLEFKDRLFGLTYGGRLYRFPLHVKPEANNNYTLLFFDPAQEFATELDYKAGGLLKVSGDKLTLCLMLNPTRIRGKLPDDFKAPAGSGHLLLEFRREK